MHLWKDAGPRLALLADAGRNSSETIRPLLFLQGIELIHARTGPSALELLQRMTDRFTLALVSLDLPALAGSIIIETLRHFRPALPVICLAGTMAAVNADQGNCLQVPIRETELRVQVERALGGGGPPTPVTVVSPVALARAKAGYAANGSLVEASREIARGLSEDRAPEG